MLVTKVTNILSTDLLLTGDIRVGSTISLPKHAIQQYNHFLYQK